MNQSFSFKSNIKDIQNKLLSQNIREISNIELLNSEEAIRNVIKSYSDRFQSLGGMLIDVSKYIANSKDVIDVASFNELFQGIYIDLVALYGDLDLVDQVLSLNLQRNKNYFLNIKKRIRDLWSKLSVTRSFIYDSNPTDESYYESFYTDINSTLANNILIDKKNGFMYLNPVKTDIQNKSFLIKEITSTTYPVKNDNGGVSYTTSNLNTYEDNYNNGPRDMLQNGLWKEEIITNDIPNISVNIGSTESPITRNFKGIVSLIDIEYTYAVEFNRIDFDLFGDKAINIDAILYKRYESDTWNIVNFKTNDPLSYSTTVTGDKIYSARGSSFDVLTFYNIEKIKAKHLRLVVNQENYEFLTSDVNKNENDITSKIQKDLEERRYELVQFGSNVTDFLSTPVVDENTSLYNDIVSIIETTTSIDNILKKIEKVLLPQINIVEYSFDNTIKFEIGLWAIEPKLERYNSLVGLFNSIPYKIKDKALISASINTKQTQPDATTCNWYFDYNGKTIPVIENSNSVRKEPIHAVDLSSYPSYSLWNSGTFVLLDFPVNPLLSNQISVYENGVYTSNITSKIAFLNSRLLFLNDIQDGYGTNYVLRYDCALYNTVNLYVLAPKPSKYVSNKNIPLGVISTKKEVLQAFIKDMWISYGSDATQKRYLSEDYVVVSATATVEEAQEWFGTNFNSCIFIANNVNYITSKSDKFYKYENIVSYSDTKLIFDYDDALDYLNDSEVGYANFDILSTIKNIAPIPSAREV